MAFIFHFEALIAREKIDENALSIGLRKKIANLRKLHQAIAETEKDVKAGGLSAEKKAELEQKLVDSKAAEPDMDQEIVDGIKKWIPKQEKNKIAGERLRKANEAKKAKTATPDPEPSPTPAPDPTPAPAPSPAPTPTPSPAPAVPPAPATPPADDSEKKGKMAWWGWALIIGGGLVLGVVGVQAARRMAERSAAE